MSRTATDRLTGALVVLASNGERPRCSDPATKHMWTSDDAEERALAARWCVGCPILTVCHQAAEENKEEFGVWASVDRVPVRTRKAKTKETT